MSSFLTRCAVVAGGEAEEDSVSFAQALILDSSADAAHDACAFMAKYGRVVAHGDGAILNHNILQLACKKMDPGTQVASYLLRLPKGKCEGRCKGHAYRVT